MKFSIVLVALIVAVFSARGQLTIGSKITTFDTLRPVPGGWPYLFSPSHNLSKITITPPVPLNFYTQNFGFFCRQELKMQRAHIPLAFRLGSMDYCDKMEQKTR